MRASLRENAPCALMAGAGCAVLAWFGLYGFAWNDYEVEAQPAVHALVGGHLAEFLRLAPAYGGSLVERAPFAVLPGLWGGGELAVYRMLALPCLLASAVLAVVIVSGMRRAGSTRLARACALGLCVATPTALSALELGHSEEILSACLCVAAVLLAATVGGRAGPRCALAAGLALGLAVATKQSAVLATGPVLAALPARQRPLCVASAAASAGALLVPFLLVPSGAVIASSRAVASTTSTIFQPWQVWWFVGRHGPLVHGLFGATKPGYRTAPAWTGAISHALILAVGAALAAALLGRARRRTRRGLEPLPAQQALLALALIMLLRCVLDIWDNAYYPLPFLLALLAWEARAQPRRPPLLALSAAVLTWASFSWLPAHVSADAQSALFLAWTLPLATFMALGLARRGGGLYSTTRSAIRTTSARNSPARLARLARAGPQ
jgi:4-amino-4-deoxy-L-arabinose transferase-like glycosyltransferase